MPRGRQPRSNRGRPHFLNNNSEEAVDEQHDDEEIGDTSFLADEGQSQIPELVKNLVRLAIACEFSRLPIRRQEISSRVIGRHHKLFAVVFKKAQEELQQKFGMVMVELPVREKSTYTQKRAAQRSERAVAASSKSWVLKNTLPKQYCTSDVLSLWSLDEEEYNGMVCLAVSLVYLNQNCLPETKLHRYLETLTGDQVKTGDKVDKTISMLVKHNYLQRIKDPLSDPPTFEFSVGPRGKIEVDEAGVLSFAKLVYGEDAPTDLEERVKRSMGTDAKKPRGEAAEASGFEIAAEAGSRRTRNRNDLNND